MHMHMHAYTCMHAYACIYMHAYICMHTRMHTYACIYMHSYTCMHMNRCRIISVNSVEASPPAIVASHVENLEQKSGGEPRRGAPPPGPSGPRRLRRSCVSARRVHKLWGTKSTLLTEIILHHLRFFLNLMFDLFCLPFRVSGPVKSDSFWSALHSDKGSCRSEAI